MTGKSLLRAVVAYLGVAALLVLSAAAAPLSDPDSGTGKSTGIYTMNTSKTGSANLVVSFVRSSDGGVESSVGRTINPMGRAFVSSGNEIAVSNWLGSAVLYSDHELASMARVRWTGGTASDGITQGTYTGFGEGSTQVFVPNLFMRPWMYSTIAVQNLGASEADFHISYYTRGESTPFAQVVDSNVPADANRYYDLKYTGRSTDPSKIPTFPSSDWLGAAIVTSANNIAVVVTTHWQDYAGIYQGFGAADADYQMYVSSVFKRKFKNWFSFTGMLVQNTENTSATIHLMLYDRDGNLDAELWDTVGPMSAKGYNTRYLGDSPGEPFYDLGFDWLGSAVIDSTTRIAVQVNTLWPGKVVSSSNNAIALGQGTLEIFLPHMAKKLSGSTWIEYCGAIVQNLSDQTNNVDVYVYPTNGGTDWNDYLMHWQVAVDPWSSFGTNTRYSSEWASVPNDWEGTMYLSGQYDIGAIVNCPRNDSAFTYNGINR